MEICPGKDCSFNVEGKILFLWHAQLVFCLTQRVWPAIGPQQVIATQVLNAQRIIMYPNLSIQSDFKDLQKIIRINDKYKTKD